MHSQVLSGPSQGYMTIDVSGNIVQHQPTEKVQYITLQDNNEYMVGESTMYRR